MSVESDDLEELTGEIRRLIESNKAFLDRLGDDDFQADDEADEQEPAEDLEDFEEL